MAVVELDPVFVKALKLMHSKAKDSTAQLKALLDDAIAQRKGLKNSFSHNEFDKTVSMKSRGDEDLKKREPEKRPSEKSVKDPSEPDIKKSKLDLQKSRSKEEKESKEKEKERERAKKEKEKRERDAAEAQRVRDKAEKEKREAEAERSSVKGDTEVMVVSDEEGGNTSQMDAGDFALEMGIACVVCKQFDVSSGNQLVECQECHNLYHQECHKPPVTEEEIVDPRFVWYCSRCTRSLKKMVFQKPVKPKPVVATSANVKDAVAPSGKISKPDSSSSTKAFRKIDPKVIVTPKEPSPGSSSKPMVGLAGLAANLVKPRHEVKNSSSGRKSDSKGDSSKSGKSSESKSGYKSDSSYKSSSGKSDDKSSKTSSGKEEKERRSEGGHKSSSKHDSSSSSSSSSSSKPSSSSSSHGKEKTEKKSESSSSSSKWASSDRLWDKAETKPSNGSGDYKGDKSESSKKSASHSEVSKSESPPTKPSSLSSSSSLTSASAPSTPTTTAEPSFKGSLERSNSSSSNKQAVANLSMVTANKRIQMMKKKAQSKPEKKVHIK